MMGEIGELLGLPQIISKWGSWQRNQRVGKCGGLLGKGGRGGGWGRGSFRVLGSAVKGS